MDKPQYNKIFDNGSSVWTRQREKDQESCKCLICRMANLSGGVYRKLQKEIKVVQSKPKSPKICPKCLSDLFH